MFHEMPPALAWLWRLVSPRGHANPSITASEKGMPSEGVGSYQPFLIGPPEGQANLLLEQFAGAKRTRYILVPNQHVGCWRTGFMSLWMAREFFARSAGGDLSEIVEPARCPLLGYAFKQIELGSFELPQELFRTHLQPEVGLEGYDAGAKMLRDFFRKTLRENYRSGRIDPVGRRIIACACDGGTLKDYASFF
jgi:hypothetical protein